MILTSLFTTTTANSAAIDGAFYGNAMELAKCLLVLVILVPWVFAATWACLWITDKLITLRVSGETRLRNSVCKAMQRWQSTSTNVNILYYCAAVGAARWQHVQLCTCAVRQYSTVNCSVASS
jgi:hypothetical protein